MKTPKQGVLFDMLKQLNKYCVKEKVDMPVWETYDGDYLGEGKHEFRPETKETLKLGDHWLARYDCARIFKTQVTLPSFVREVPVRPEPKPAPIPTPEPAPVPQPEPDEEVIPWVIRGELFRTYVMVEQGDKVMLIDKHAAHERVNFDRLKAADYKPMVQELLVPVTFTPAPEERAVLVEQTGLLARFGFEVEEFGTSALAVRSVPDYLETGEVEPALLELARRIRVTGSADPTSARDELLHTMACKAAIKGGQKNGAEELHEVAEMVMSGAVKYCPHGRPVAIELTRAQLEKQFKR